jgi:hypothetical protein
MNDEIEQQPDNKNNNDEAKRPRSGIMSVLPSIVAVSQPSMKQGYSDQVHFKKR